MPGNKTKIADRKRNKDFFRFDLSWGRNQGKAKRSIVDAKDEVEKTARDLEPRALRHLRRGWFADAGSSVKPEKKNQKAWALFPG